MPSYERRTARPRNHPMMSLEGFSRWMEDCSDPQGPTGTDVSINPPGSRLGRPAAADAERQGGLRRTGTTQNWRAPADRPVPSRSVCAVAVHGSWRHHRSVRFERCDYPVFPVRHECADGCPVRVKGQRHDVVAQCHSAMLVQPLARSVCGPVVGEHRIRRTPQVTRTVDARGAFPS